MSELVARGAEDAVAAGGRRPPARRMAGVSVTAVLAVALSVALSGCAMFDKDDSGKSDVYPEQGLVAGGATTGPSRTIAQATFESPAAQGAKVEIGIVELRVTGQLAQLTLSITPRVPGSGSPTVYELPGGLDPDVSLIDNVNLKRYVVVKDSAGTPLQPDWIKVHLRNDQPNAETYMFAAPPEGVRTVDVVFGQWPPFRNVPVSR
jgi:hypothetical protein